MTYQLTWLPQMLQDAGLKVATVDGWDSRGYGDVGQVVGVICHHTAGPRSGNMPSLQTLIDGRSDLPGPLAQVGLGRDGTCYVIAAGKCNHAGKGVWKGVTTGNTSFIGIEAENTGLSNDSPWPDVQMDAYRCLVAAVLKRLGQPADFCAGHKEYALPAGRKSDPDFDMVAFRASVAGVMAGTMPTPPAIPAIESATAPGSAAPRATLRRPSTSELVKVVQAKVGVVVDGNFGAKTEAAVRAFQRTEGLIPDGIVGPKTWAMLDTVPNPSPV